jgi:hypothetical protein
MTSIQSDKQTINKPLSEVFTFLANANNHKALMPENIYNWSSTEDECKFTIQNMAKLELKISERDANGKIVIVPSAAAPFDLNIVWTITAISETSCEAQMTINADLNPFIKMMAVSPLTKLVNHQVQALVANV